MNFVEREIDSVELSSTNFDMKIPSRTSPDSTDSNQISPDILPANDEIANDRVLQNDNEYATASSRREIGHSTFTNLQMPLTGCSSPEFLSDGHQDGGQRASSSSSVPEVSLSDLINAGGQSNRPIPIQIATHTHIKGLGRDENGFLLHRAAGFVGQVEARQAAALAVDMIRKKKMAGKALLLAGDTGTGKTALALGISQELGDNVPFCAMVGSEVTNTEVLMQNLSRAIVLRIKQTKDVYEGEVTEFCAEETDSVTGGNGEAIRNWIIGLKTVKGSKQLKLDPTLYNALMRENVAVRDVVYIEVTSGAVKRVGRSDAFANQSDLESDLEVEKYVPLPIGEVHKQKESVHDVTLHDLDAATARPEGGRDIIFLMGQLMKLTKSEMLKQEINKLVHRFVGDGVAELVPEVLFIDEVHRLDTECFSYLSHVLDCPLSLTLIFATNREKCSCLPPYLLDRVTIIGTRIYTRAQMIDILAIRAQVEGLLIDEECLISLGEIGQQTSLRHAVRLMYPASIMAKSKGRDTISMSDLEELKGQFLDAKSSAKLLSEQEDK